MSGSVKVEFLGICTHIEARYLPVEVGENARPHVERDKDLRRRVVLVDASRGAHLNGSALPPHEARMEIDPQSVLSMGAPAWGLESVAPGSWRLRGVKLWIENAQTPTEGIVMESPADLPSLTRRTNEKIELDPVVVSRGGAAAYFDITHGQLDAATWGESVVTTLFIQTPQDEPVLCVYSFASAETTKIKLAPATKIVLSNAGRFADAPNDFYLHYLVTTKIPLTIDPPAGTWKPTLSALSAGCSNSNYP